MTASVLTNTIKNGGFDSMFTALYGNAEDGRQRALALAESFMARFGDVDGAALFSAPGRVELIGNHTDHAGGMAVSATIGADILALAAPDATRVALYGETEVDITLDGKEKHEEEKGTSAALARGMAWRYGGGFVGVTNSRIPLGVGLASSAAYTLLCGKIANSFYGGGNADPMHLALTAAEIERTCYGKACGLLDQITIARGGTMQIDFISNPPAVESINVGFGSYGVYLVNTGVPHADSSKYAAIAEDMDKAAEFFGCKKLGQVAVEEFTARGDVLRKRMGERVFRRAQHFFDENKRVKFFVRRAGLGQTDVSLYAINGSGISSRTNLGNVHDRAVEATAALKDIAAAVRIHGGGFGGAMLCYVAPNKRDDFYKAMQGLFGANSVLPVSIRPMGVCKL